MIKNNSIPISIVIGALILAGTWVYVSKPGIKKAQPEENISFNNSAVDGVVLPVKWGDLGQKMLSAGVIDEKKIEEIYAGRGGLDEETKKLLYNADNGNLKIMQQNAGVILNLLWAFGLANKNDILEKGPMIDPAYGGAGNFASTGGWTIAKGNAMEHYSRHSFVILTSEQQALVEKVSRNIYRPCCDNSTYFPDCNHGMAMLGLLELMASQGASEEEMYKTALTVNTFWFPDNYSTIANYFQANGRDLNKIDPKEILGVNYSSGSGYQEILKEVIPVERKSGGSCGV